MIWAAPSGIRRTAQRLHYRRKAGLMFDPWMKVWQLMHG
jgi:hypothetical protein